MAQIETGQPERLDIDACVENLAAFAARGDARSCRDVGRALARELTETREALDQITAECATAVRWMRDAQRIGLKAIAERDRLREVAEWLMALDEPGNEDRRTVTLDRIINRARTALGKEG